MKYRFTWVKGGERHNEKTVSDYDGEMILDRLHELWKDGATQVGFEKVIPPQRNNSEST